MGSKIVTYVISWIGIR